MVQVSPKKKTKWNAESPVLPANYIPILDCIAVFVLLDAVYCTDVLLLIMMISGILFRTSS